MTTKSVGGSTTPQKVGDILKIYKSDSLIFSKLQSLGSK